jgi:hypothetical protein
MSTVDDTGGSVYYNGSRQLAVGSESAVGGRQWTPFAAKG